jgi:hypothetical protein
MAAVFASSVALGTGDPLERVRTERYHALVEVSCSPGVFDFILDPSHGLIVDKKELGGALPGWQADQHINVVWRPRPILG